MEKKYNPEQTIDKIITVSANLFYEKGYEKTTMQEIVNALGMSKGAIFYHFKSKEEILTAVLKKQSLSKEQTFSQWINGMKGSSSKEILISLVKNNFSDQQIYDSSNLFISQLFNPHFIMAGMQDIMNNIAPQLAAILRDENANGCIITEFPEEFAEIFFFLLFVWCNPLIFECDTGQLQRRFRFFKQIIKQMGVDIIDL